MRHVLFWFFIIVFGLWTVLVFSGLMDSQPNGFASDAEQAGNAIGSLMVLVIWAIVALPLGLFALVVRPKG